MRLSWGIVLIILSIILLIVARNWDYIQSKFEKPIVYTPSTQPAPVESKPITREQDITADADPPMKKRSPLITLDRSKQYKHEADFEWIIFLPPGSGWVNVGQRLIGAGEFFVVHYNVVIFQTPDWVETYEVRVNNFKPFKPDRKSFSLTATDKACYPVYIKNISNQNLTLTMKMDNYPYHYNPPKCGVN